MPYTAFTQWGAQGGSRDIQGLNDNLINALTGGGVGEGLAKESTLLQVEADLRSTVGDFSVADLLVEIQSTLSLIDANTESITPPGSNVVANEFVGQDAADMVGKLNEFFSLTTRKFHSSVNFVDNTTGESGIIVFTVPN